MRAVNVSGVSPNSNTILVVTVPPSPTVNSATEVTSSSFKANWGAAAGAASYRLDVSSNSNFTSYVPGFNNLEVSGLSSTVTGLSPNSNYYYRVIAVNTGGVSSNSPTMSVLTVPKAPVAAAATGVSASAFTANWNSVAGAGTYRLDVSTNSAFSSYVSGYQNRNVTGTSASVSGLTSGVMYYYRVRAVNAGGISANSQTISVITIPPVPLATAATETSTNSFKANWNSVTGATAYQLDVSTNSAFSSFLSGFNGASVSGNSKSVTGLNAGTIYYYRVRASNASGASANSNTIEAITVPSAPVIKPATNIASNSFTANWNSSVGAASYLLDVSTNSSFSTYVSGYQNKSVTGVSANVSGLQGGVAYHYRVRAVNAGGVSIHSGSTSVLTVPVPPTAIAPTGATTASFTARWNASTGATSYRLDVSTNSSFSSFVSGFNNLTVSGTSANVTGLSIGTVYYYRVRAVNASGVSSNSNTITTATIPAAPGVLSASSVTVNSFTAKWNAVSGATSYQLDVSTASNFSSFVTGYNNLTVTGTNKAVTGLNAGTTYYYRLRAVNAGGASANSASIPVITIPPPPVITAPSDLTARSFKANWNPAPGAVSYRLDLAYDNAFTRPVAGYVDLLISGSNKNITGLSPNVQYFYRLRAVNGSGTSVNSTVHSTLTLTTEDEDMNWVKTSAFDGEGNMIAQSKVYFDGTGRQIQSQYKDMTTRQIIASQPLFDASGSPVGDVLPAPICNTEFGFRDKFLTNLNGTAYGPSDFDVNRNNPSPVGTDFGTVGWFYSGYNDMDPFTALTSYPYSRTWTEKGPDPKLSVSAAPGDAHRMGAGKESATAIANVSNDPELLQYYSWRTQFISEPVLLKQKGDGYKIISTDPDGKETVTYIDAAGNTVIYGVKNNGKYEYAYIYYDDAANVVAEIAPEGVAAKNPSKFLTIYKYNHQGWLLESASADEGKTEYVYSFDGKIRFSQNAQQKIDNKFSYTNYDRLGRPIESGEYSMAGTGYYIFENHYNVTANPKSIHRIVDHTGAAGALDAERCDDVTEIMYDVPDPACPEMQKFLYGAISRTRNANVTAWYSYDYMGRLEWMIQDIAGLGQKKVAYVYDFVGNVLQVAYQPGQPDAFYHHNEYDADQRLSKVYTSKDGVNKTLQAVYHYNILGALARVELAGNLQGIDYTYTAQGLLKTINHGDIDKDPGMDGQPGPRSHFKRDAFGMTIEYYSNDYSGSAYNAGVYNVPGSTDNYAGAIKAIGWHNGNQNHQQAMYKYDYDDKNQLRAAKWGTVAKSGNAYTFNEALNKYIETIPGSENSPGYDRHGNIQALNRNDGHGNAIARYTYHYTANSNRLDHIKNNNAIFIQYAYNAIGQMTRQEENGKTMNVEYNAYGNLSAVKNGEGRYIVQFAYDDRGDRLLKKTYDKNFNPALDTWYVRDAGGNILAVYTQNYQAATPLALTEAPIYGAGRIGVYMPELDNYLYEIADHLGNVRSIVARENLELDFLATMEQANAAEEEAEFVNIPTSRQLDALHNHTPGGSYAARLNGSQGRVAGPGIALRINPGDTIKAEVYAKYLASANGNTNLIAGLAASIAGAFGYNAGDPETQPIFDLFNQVLGGAALFTNPNSNVPKAYLIALYFDNNFRYKDFSYHMLSASGLNAWEKLSFQKIANHPGYAYIYVVNESAANINVFFDDLKVTLKQDLVVSGNDYYPFGLPIADRSYEREDYRFDYQGQFSEKDDETGWNAFQLRMYDPRIGRWISPDPYGQFFSGYIAMGNNPVINVDPKGGEIVPIQTFVLADIVIEGARISSEVPLVLGFLKGLNAFERFDWYVPKGTTGYTTEAQWFNEDPGAGWEWVGDEYHIFLAPQLPDLSFSSGLDPKTAAHMRAAAQLGIYAAQEAFLKHELTQGVTFVAGFLYGGSEAQLLSKLYSGVKYLYKGKKAIELAAKTSTSVIKGFTQHATNQAVTRGFKTADILKIVKEGTPVQAMGRYGAQTRYTLGGNTVVLNAQGKVVTVFSNAPGTANGLGKGFFIPFE